MGSKNWKDLKKYMWEVYFRGTWKTSSLGGFGGVDDLKKAEMAKPLKNGLIMIETNPLNHNWSHFIILSGLTLHQFQKKLLLSVTRFIILTIGSKLFCCKNTTLPKHQMLPQKYFDKIVIHFDSKRPTLWYDYRYKL